MLAFAAFTDWLTGVSGTLVFVATAGLAWIARRQMKQLAKQAEDTREDVLAQIGASADIARGTMDAARAALQPMVFAQPKGVIGFDPRQSNTGISHSSTRIRWGFDTDYRTTDPGWQ